MINLRKHDPIADAVKEILQQEALKGNQHLIDKNKNNKVDAHDFKILRGEKKAVKEEETVEEGIKDVAKKDNKKMQEAEYKGVRPVSNAFTQTAPYPSFKKKKPAPAKKPVNEGGINDLPSRGMFGTDTKGHYGVYRNSGPGDTKLKIVSKHKTIDSASKQVDKLRKKSGKDDHYYGHLSAHQPEQGKIPKHFHEEEVQGKTLKQFMENAFDYKTPRKPEPNGGSGVKQGSAYGGSKQKDKPEQATEKK